MFRWLRQLFGRPVVSVPSLGKRESDRPPLAPPAEYQTAALAADGWPARDAKPPPPRPAWLARIPATVLFVDVETTGLRPGADRIVSFAGILLTTADLAHGGVGLQYGHYIVNPGRLCHPRAAAVHGYSDWLLRHQEQFADVAANIVELIDKAELVVAHNAEFDLGFIDAELVALGRPPFGKRRYCTVEGYRALNRGGSARLDNVAAEIGLSRGGLRHGALEDAWLAMMVYLRLHDCPYRMPFSTFPNPHPSNLRPASPKPDDVAAVEQTVATIRQMFSRTDARAPHISPGFVPRGLDQPDGIDVTASVTGRPMTISGGSTSRSSTSMLAVENRPGASLSRIFDTAPTGGSIYDRSVTNAARAARSGSTESDRSSTWMAWCTNRRGFSATSYGCR